MFEKSQMYKRLEKVRREVTQLMCECFITDFTNYLHEIYLHKRGSAKISFSAWLGEQRAYSKIVGGRLAGIAPYDLFQEVDKVFEDRDAFRNALEEEINSRYGEANAAKLLVRIEESGLEWTDLPDLITFEYDETSAWGD